MNHAERRHRNTKAKNKRNDGKPCADGVWLGRRRPCRRYCSWCSSNRTHRFRPERLGNYEDH